MNKAGRTLFPVALVSLILYFLFLVRGVLLPFILAATLAYLLNPVIEFFVVRGVRRSPVVIGLYAVLMATLLSSVYWGGTFLNREAVTASLRMPEYIQKERAFFEKVGNFGEEKDSSVARSPVLALLKRHSDLIGSAREKARNWPVLILSHMPSLASHILPAFEFALLVPFIAFFLMMEGPSLLEGFFQRIPAQYVEMSLNVVVEIDNSLGRYLRGLSLEALSAGLCALVGFWLIGLDYAPQVAVIMGIGGMIPYLGPVSGAIAGGAIALFQWGTPGGIFKVLIVCFGVRFIEDWFLQPLILKRAVHLHPVVIIFSLMAGTALWGFWGLVFAVPAACMLRVTFPVVYGWYQSEYFDGIRRLPSEVTHIPII